MVEVKKYLFRVPVLQFMRTLSNAVDLREKLNFKAEFTWE
jgi:hypothetical protein